MRCLSTDRNGLLQTFSAFPGPLVVPQTLPGAKRSELSPPDSGRCQPLCGVAMCTGGAAAKPSGWRALRLCTSGQNVPAPLKGVLGAALKTDFHWLSASKYIFLTLPVMKWQGHFSTSSAPRSRVAVPRKSPWGSVVR